MIDGHYYYPDGVAVEKVAHKLGVPFTVTARGTDINYIPQHHPVARKRIQHVFTRAKRNMAVCQALLDCMTDELGASKDTAVVARNGVDLELFAYADETLHQQRQSEKGVKEKKLVLAVGHLVERKGHHLIIDAIKDIEGCELWILGAGPMAADLDAQIKSLGLGHRVRLIGEMKQADMVPFYQAADCLVLASSREGWANVLLESMACGTPVVATKVWGTPEVMPIHEKQFLVERNSTALKRAIATRLDATTSRKETRAHAEKFSWKATSDLLKSVWSECIAEAKAAK